MSNTLLIWGAGGHGKVILDIARNTGRFERIAFLDDDRMKAGLSFCSCTLLGGFEQMQRFPKSSFVVAVGDNRNRARCFSLALENGCLPAVLIHSTAVIAASADIGEGTVIMPGAIVNADAIIGKNCIINTGAVVEHDCRIGDHAHLSPRVVLGGGVTVGTYAHIGIGAVVLPGATIGEESIVGAGAVVVREAPAHCTMVGIPARILSHAN